mmetsp:Transcript_2300/g.4679  ORF Transcript_2300/g.4679 Transcript_2300/m.4679 type:complete len:368 (+) Transcript_2300:929-2032(+)
MAADAVREALVGPVDEDLANLDSLAAVSEGVLHRLPRPYDAHPAQPFAESHANVHAVRRSGHHLLREGQLAEAVLNHQADEAVGVEHKVRLGGVAVADGGVHAARLVVAREHVQVGVDAAQVVLPELGLDVLHNQIDGHHVVASRPRDDDVRRLLGGKHKLLKHGLDELGVLVDDALDVPAALQSVALDAPRQAHVVVRVHENLHVEVLHNLVKLEEQDALDDHHVRGVDAPALAQALVRDEAVLRYLHVATRLQRHQAFGDFLGVKRVGMVKVVFAHVGLLVLRQAAVEGVHADHGNALVVQALHNLVANRGLAGRSTSSHTNDKRFPLHRVLIREPVVEEQWPGSRQTLLQAAGIFCTGWRKSVA